MKKEFRKKVINLRKEKDKDFIKYNSDIITEKLLQLDCVKNAKTIMLYLDFNNEVATDNLIKKLINLGKTVASPITLKEERKLIPSQITDLENGIQYGAYNIREPKPECSPAIDIKDLDVVIVPAVAYDKNCYRLGYGGGNMMTNCPKVVKWGVRPSVKPAVAKALTTSKITYSRPWLAA